MTVAGITKWLGHTIHWVHSHKWLKFGCKIPILYTWVTCRQKLCNLVGDVLYALTGGGSREGLPKADIVRDIAWILYDLSSVPEAEVPNGERVKNSNSRCPCHMKYRVAHLVQERNMLTPNMR